MLDVNPVTGTAKADEGGSRERVLTPEELRRLWSGLGDGRFSDIVRLLLLTGQRRNEIGKLQWSEVDLGRKVQQGELAEPMREALQRWADRLDQITTHPKH